ncbi:MAG: tetratricopeptide repeat protein [bacterium]|nr:tetratricopeptide repeat protein [bacterium]
MNYAERFFRQSDYWYNDGLRKANMRDLSGAVSSLKRSLQYNRSNIAARNLLGLVYYGRGEVVEALVEWIISKNLKSYENIANYYIKKVQESPNELEQINQAIHKYNQCLVYARQHGEDLAIIQLKKVIQAHPTFLKAHQLLALLYIETEQYAKARQLLRRAHKMDITNTITLAYMHELSQMQKQKVTKLKEEKEETVTYSLGNETIIQPVSASLKDNAAVLTIVNIIIGIVLGAAVVWFLISPTVIQNKTRETNNTIVELSEEVAARDTQISVLKDELESYRSTDEEAKSAIESSGNTQESYETVLRVKELYDAGATSNADMTELLLQVQPDALGERGKAVYDEVAGELFPKMCERYYQSAQEKIAAEDYAGAVTDLEKVVQMDLEYDGGSAKLLLEDTKQKVQ